MKKTFLDGTIAYNSNDMETVLLTLGKAQTAADDAAPFIKNLKTSSKTIVNPSISSGLSNCLSNMNNDILEVLLWQSRLKSLKVELDNLDTDLVIEADKFLDVINYIMGPVPVPASSTSLIDTLGIDYLSQEDPRWAGINYVNGTGTIATSACGFSCLAMVMRYFSGDQSITPVSMINQLRGLNIGVPTTESSVPLPSMKPAIFLDELLGNVDDGSRNILDDAGIKAEVIRAPKKAGLEKMTNALESGKPVISYISRHYVLLKMNNNHDIVVLDPIKNENYCISGVYKTTGGVQGALRSIEDEYTRKRYNNEYSAYFQFAVAYSND